MEEFHRGKIISIFEIYLFENFEYMRQQSYSFLRMLVLAIIDTFVFHLVAQLVVSGCNFEFCMGG